MTPSSPRLSLLIKQLFKKVGGSLNTEEALHPRMTIREAFSHHTFFHDIRSIIPDYIVNTVLSTAHHFSRHSDTVVWTPNLDGSYSFKSVYEETKPKRSTDILTSKIRVCLLVNRYI
ncbi:unnamed protein product [Cuscuta europaea]|uniref:Uncharacterized protein n=1 Tax=Cuscuta europaea TaxID=41803 RepID=A0A9P0ZVE4_CUSEU|nr:unnamed protein product [Cuscuta europaea]